MGTVARVLAGLAAVAALAGCAGTPATRPTTVATSAALIVVPNVVGENADVAVDQLKKLGFTAIDLGTVDGHKIVLLPQNWTVKTQSAKPGDRLAADSKIVLGCARIG